MVVSGNWLIARQIVTTILYVLLRVIFITVQSIYWQLNGTARKLREARLSQNYERSAHVLDVVYFHEFCSALTITIERFLYTHNRFENPQYIIDNDDITLMTFNERDAIFCEPKERGMHLWRLKYGAFLYTAQKKFCRRLIVVPLSTFHRLADIIGDPRGELSFLFHVPRAGSTLLVQIMEYTERCISISEPPSTTAVAMKYRKCGDSPEIRQLARDVIRWECRPYQTIQPPPLGYFLKLMSVSIFALPLFRELFLSSKCLFIYRDIEKVAKSVSRTSQVVPSFNMVTKIGGISSRFTKMALDSLGFNGSDFCIRTDSNNSFMPGVVLAVVLTSSYLDAHRRGLNISALRYEDLVARPLDMCRIVLEYCNFPVSLAERAVKAFDIDSQRSSVLSKSVVGNFKEPEMTQQTKLKLNELLTKYEMPLIGEAGILEGTLRCP